MSDRRLDGTALREWAHAGVGDLITHVDEINRLNVFPVADADTGTNMLFTMRSALARADAAATAGTWPTWPARCRRARCTAPAATPGSSCRRSCADSPTSPRRRPPTPRATSAEIDAALLGAALRHAIGLVVTSMGGECVPGTIVSVLQAAAGAAEDRAVDGDDLAGAVTAAADAAAVALDKTPGQLAVLADAGVVDSGGRGLLVLLDALCRTVTGRAPARPVYAPASPVTPAVPTAHRPSSK